MIIRALVVFVFIFCFVSCSTQGGGNSGPGMSFGSGRTTKPISTGISYVNLTGRLISALNSPIENAQVTFASERSEETVETDFDGRFLLSFVAKKGERVSIKVVNGEAIYTDSFILDQQDIVHGSAILKVVGHGKISVSNLKWYNSKI